MKRLATMGAITALSVLSACVVFFALIGLIFMFGTTHASQSVSEPNCDRIERLNGVMYCLNVTTE